MRVYYPLNPSYWHFVCAAFCMTTLIVIGCGQKEVPPQALKASTVSGTIVEIDMHGNAVTDILWAAFTEQGWKLGDTLEVTFGSDTKIEIPFVDNYGDVPVGAYLGRFSVSTGNFKIAINEGSLAEALKLAAGSGVMLKKIEVSKKPSAENPWL